MVSPTAPANTAELVERLKSAKVWVSVDLAHEAASIIERQAEENAGLREVLIRADLKIRSFQYATQEDVAFIREALSHAKTKEGK